ncbi:hypothetical protein H2203_003440 [Taxawa tesnikishii (nom. ined.)]|nr:hypothetical protein H2203_003440 [Dothideales sp. JES 119]
MEQPERKRLKSSFKPGPAPAPLPAGWTEHTAPSGHKYYYNPETKQSTYTRPAAQTQPEPPPYQSPAPGSYAAQGYGAGYPGQLLQNGYNTHGQHYPYPASAALQGYQDPYNGGLQGQEQNEQQSRKPFRSRPQPEDRPKHKKVIPNCAPWVLVYTKLGRRFVHNTESKESFWKFPEDVMKAVIEFDRLELDKKLGRGKDGNDGAATGANNMPVGDRNRKRRSESLQREDEEAMAAELAAAEQEGEARPVSAVEKRATGEVALDAGDESSEYEEVEVTDTEGEGEDEEAEANRPAGEDAAAQDQPVEFDEDDIAYQLAAMGEDYGLDPGEYGEQGDEAWEEGAEGLPLTDEDSAALFHGYIIEDERYTVLNSTKARREAYDAWTRDRIVELRKARETVEKQDPRIPYLALLAAKATPKLYWPEFKRKYKKEPPMRDAKLADKEREKLYRDHINRLKLPQSQLKSDLAALMKSLPLSVLNKDVKVEQLPKEMLKDLRYISLPADSRDPLIKAYIDTLSPRPEGGETAEEAAERERGKKEREKREAALRERERRVEEEKRKRERDVRIGMAKMREGERELERAMRVGKEGLRAQLGAGDDVEGATKLDGEIDGSLA